MKKPEQPCVKECPNREVGCATKCERWKAYVKARDEYYAERHKLKEEYEQARDQAIKRHIRRMKEGFF